ncbi:MAG: hypothetical protein NC915_06590, partial [Candidatus Omnitrophica bacterium]|nr:hypothetical protein [Candidatus Omnitrophota bacterium]
MNVKKKNYSQWLAIKTGKTIAEWLDEGKTLEEIRKIAKDHNIDLPVIFLQNYKKWYLNQK